MALEQSWHSDIKTWKRRNEFLLKNEIMSDCSFIVSDGTTKTIIPAHKYILGGKSTEFYNLFYLMKAASDEIPIEDVSIEIFSIFLKFLYTETIDLTMENVEELLKLSKRYSVKHFDEFCCEFLIKNVDKVTALSVMDKFSDFKIPILMDKCVKLISSSPLIFESPTFYKISICTLTELLKSEDLKGFKEITIFNGVNKWAECFCEENNQIINSDNKRSALKSALPYIRFPTMSFSDFTSCTFNETVLANAEIVKIIQCIQTNGVLECMYSSKKRLGGTKVLNLYLEEHVMKCGGFSYASSCTVFEFSVNKPIIFHGFGMFGRNEIASDILVIKLKDKNNTVLLETEIKIEYDGSQKIYDHLFENTLLLESNICYKIDIQSKIPYTLDYYFVSYNAIKRSVDLEGFHFDTEVKNKTTASIIFSE